MSVFFCGYFNSLYQYYLIKSWIATLSLAVTRMLMDNSPKYRKIGKILSTLLSFAYAQDDEKFNCGVFNLTHSRNVFGRIVCNSLKYERL